MERIRIGIVGLGAIGKLHLEAAALNSKSVAAAVCDTDPELAKKKAEFYGISKYTTDYKELVRDDSIDALIIATPDQVHREMVCAALYAGKHILCEKPMALNGTDCAAMIEASKKSGKVLMIGQVCRCTPAFIKAKEIVDSGVIGDIYFAESEYAHDYTDLNSDWRVDMNAPRHPVTGGGCHAVDLLRWIVGDPREVYAYTNKKALDETWPCDDSAVAVFKFDNDVMGKVYVSTGCKRNYTMRTVIYGTKGTIIVDNTSSQMSLFLDEFEGKRELFGAELKTVEMKLPVSVNNHNVPLEVDEFCDVINGVRPLEISGTEGASTVAVCEAIIKSAAEGKPVEPDYSFK